MLIDSEKVGIYKNNGNEKIDRSINDMGNCFILTTAERIRSIYTKWYIECNIEDLNSSDEIIEELKKDRRFSLLNKVKEILGDQASIYYRSLNGRQYPITHTLEWYLGGHNGWISCGIITDSPQKFAAASTNGEKIEVGLRRLPNETSINWEDKWYYEEPDDKFEYKNENLAEEIVVKLKSLIL